MSKQTTIFLSLLLGFASPPRASAGPVEEGWDLIRDEDDIKVYRRDIADSNLREFRGIGMVPGAIPKLVALLADPKKMPEWTDNCESSELIEKNFTDTDFSKSISDYYEVIYAVSRVPWPLKYRDYIIKSNMLLSTPNPKEPPHLVISSHNVTDLSHPESDEFVRVPTMKINIDMMPIGAGEKTLVDFTVLVDPGGMVPDMIVNAVSKSLPYRTIRNIAKLASSTDYNRNVEKLVKFQYDKARAINGH